MTTTSTWAPCCTKTTSTPVRTQPIPTTACFPDMLSRSRRCVAERLLCPRRKRRAQQPRPVLAGQRLRDLHRRQRHNTVLQVAPVIFCQFRIDWPLFCHVFTIYFHNQTVGFPTDMEYEMSAMNATYDIKWGKPDGTSLKCDNTGASWPMISHRTGTIPSAAVSSAFSGENAISKCHFKWHFENGIWPQFKTHFGADCCAWTTGGSAADVREHLVQRVQWQLDHGHEIPPRPNERQAE